MKLFFLISFALFLFSCKNASERKETSLLDEYSIFRDSIPRTKKRVRLIKLKSKVSKTLNELQSFPIIKGQLDTLNTASYAQIEQISSIITDQLDELKQELPDEMKTKGVLSRMGQVKNYCLKIDFEITKRVADTSEIDKNINKTLEAYNTLVIQLNETQARLPKEIEEQLKKNNEIKKDTIEGVPLF